MNNPLASEQVSISFCLPVYNVEPYLTECIDSIVRQIKNIPYEIICIDDCSTDHSFELLRKLSSDNPNIIIEQNSINRGVSFARNRSVERASGTYIWFVDPDDLLTDGAVQLLHRIAKETDSDVILGNYIRFRELNEIQNHSICGDALYEIVDSFLPSDEAGTKMCAVWAGLFRREFLTRKNLRFLEGMIAQEDTLFYYEFEQCRRKQIAVSAPVYLYRQRTGSVMRSRSEKRAESYYYSMRLMLEIYAKHLVDGNYLA